MNTAEKIMNDAKFVVDEANRVNAKQVMSSMEMDVLDDALKWMEETGGTYSSPSATSPRFKNTKQLIEAYWNGKLN